MVIISGCSYQNDNLGESGKSSSSNENETSYVTAHLSIVPAASPEKAISSVTPAVDNNEREDTPVEYTEANYFTEKVKNIIFYRDGKRYTISPDTEQDKEIIFMVKQWYVNTTE